MDLLSQKNGLTLLRPSILILQLMYCSLQHMVGSYSSVLPFLNLGHLIVYANKITITVGGLGLNLTSADTLVFMEHDWNPMRDHQVV